MSYENAPATKLVASHCVACGRPLVDAISVEAGMGPDCRDKYNHAGPDGATEEARTDVNQRVNELARGVAPAVQVAHLLIIRAHGFERLADRLEERLCDVEIVYDNRDTLILRTPFAPDFTADMKAEVYGRRWDATNKHWTVPATREAKNTLWAVIRRHFAGGIARLPGGELHPIEATS